MPNWMLTCPECKKDFVYSKVVMAVAFRDPWVREVKPDFPIVGISLQCPHCKGISTFHRHQLTHSAAE